MKLTRYSFFAIALLAWAGTAAAAPPPKKSGDVGKDLPPVTIMAVGNRLMITSDDPQALALVGELVRQLTQVPSKQGDFEVIPLKNANAADAAKVLDEAFNGPKQTAQQAAVAIFGRRRGLPEPAPNPDADRVRVVADANTNSLLVRASPLDMLAIRRLLATAIDADDVDSRAVIRSRLIPVKHAAATDLAEVIKEVYREHMDKNAAAQAGRSRRRGGRFQNANVGPDGQPRAVTLTVGVDDRSNSLVVACAEPLFEEIKGVVKQLDHAAADANTTVQVVPVKGIDPVLLQRAVDAMQGRAATGPATSYGRGNGFGSSRYSGYSGGGRNSSYGSQNSRTSRSSPSFGNSSGRGR